MSARKQCRASIAGRSVTVIGAGFALGLVFVPSTALAHSGPPPTPDTLWRTWNLDPFVIIALAIAISAYTRGVIRIWSRVGRNRGIQTWQVVLGALGFLAIAVALVSPLDPLSSALFSAHMVQHMLLVAFAPVLLILANVRVPYLWSLPPEWRTSLAAVPRQSPILERLWTALARPLPALILHSLVLWAWHAPSLYNAAIQNDLIHALEHATLFASALLFWWIVIQRGKGSRVNYGIGLLMIFGVTVQKTGLGALITFSPTAWYSEYATSTAAWGLTPIQDQQLAGAVMMGPWGFVYLVTGVILFAAWIRAIERSVDRERVAAGPSLSIGHQQHHQVEERI